MTRVINLATSLSRIRFAQKVIANLDKIAEVCIALFHEEDCFEQWKLVTSKYTEITEKLSLKHDSMNNKGDDLGNFNFKNTVAQKAIANLDKLAKVCIALFYKDNLF